MTGLSLGFVGWTLSGHLSGFQALTVTARGWWWLVLGLAASWLSLVINAIAWRVLVAWLGSRTEDLALVPLYLRTNLLKYLPGGIWHFVERLRTLQSSIGVNRALGSVLLEPLVMAVAALLWVPFGGWQSGLAPLCLLPTLVLLPRIREPLLRRLEQAKWKQMQRTEPGALDQPDPRSLGTGRGGYPWQPLTLDMGFVICRFGGFWCCVQAFDLGAVQSPGVWLAAFALAWTLGLVVPAAPGGLGVFETVLLLRLGGAVADAPLLAVTLTYRLVVTLADLLAASAAALDQTRQSGGQQR